MHQGGGGLGDYRDFFKWGRVLLSHFLINRYLIEDLLKANFTISAKILLIRKSVFSAIRKLSVFSVLSAITLLEKGDLNSLKPTTSLTGLQVLFMSFSYFNS